MLKMKITPFIIICLMALIWITRNDQAFLLLEEMSTIGEQGRLQQITAAPGRLPIEYEAAGRVYKADLYRPAAQIEAGIVLVPGVADQGLNDERLIEFAQSLARLNFMVLVPDMENLRAFKVESSDVQAIVDAFSYLTSRSFFPADAGAGISALSYAVGPAIIAALDPLINQRVDFIFGVGGYYDLTQVITFFTTGAYYLNNNWHYYSPNAYAKWIFLLSNAGLVSDADDQQFLRQLARSKLKGTDGLSDGQMNPPGREAQSILALFENRNPDRVPELIRELPAAIREKHEALTLANKDLTDLHAQLILLHGRDDNMIPYTESIALAGAIPHDQTDLYILDGLQHMEIDADLLGSWRLWRAVTALLAQRKTR